MAKDFTDTLRDTVGQVVRDATQSGGRGKSPGPLSGGRGVAAGAGLAAVAPLAAKGVTKLAKGRLAKAAAKNAVKKPGGAVGSAIKKPSAAVGDVTSKLGDSIGKGVGEKVKDKIDESGGAGGIAKEAAGSLLPGFGGGSSNGGGGGMEGVGKGRRMPVQQAIDVAVPIETAYNQWTQYEDWTEFMHRIVRASTDEEDPTTVNFQAKIWTRTRDFQAEIITQRPDERIKWEVSQGITHTGVVTFHELAPRLTRIEINMDVEPGGMIEKAARGMRHVKRAVRADLHRFKAFIEMQEMETGAWRGVIEDGELVEDHDPSYDEEREYSNVEDALTDEEREEREEDQEEDEDEEEDDDDQTARSERFERQARASSSGSGRRRSSSRSSNSGSSGNGRSSGSRSSGGRRSSGSSSSGRRKASAKKS